VPARVLALAGALLVAAGCGSSTSQSDSVRGTLKALAEESGEKTVALTPGDADFAPGPLRYSFLVIDNDGRLVSKPTAEVWIARGFEQRPFQRSVARLEPVGVPGAASAREDVQSVYVVHLRTPGPGKYWVLARPKGASINGVGNVVVRPRSYSPAVGAQAPASRTPTLADTHGKLAPLSTSTHPDRELYRTSVASALAEKRPFVVAFATPKFCTSRTCGPVVDVVSHVRRQLGATPVRFIHAEVYRGNDPAKGYNPWMRRWKLESEPWVFLVGRDGRIDAKFEGAVSARELKSAVESKLLR
jgi:hypothetical protein